jgi:iron(III) transport system substrate-binding protein
MKVLLAVLSAIILSSAASRHAQSQSALIEGAKKEGKLVWYTSMAIDTSKPLLDGFQKEYPFIKAELVRAGEEQLMNRVLSEIRAGRWTFDAISTSAISLLPEKKIIQPYLTPNRDGYLSEFKDPDGYWTGIFVNNLILGYNTKMLPPKRRPGITLTCSTRSGKAGC